MSKRKIDVYLEDDLIKEGRKIAIDENTSLSRILNQLLEDFVNSKKSEKNKIK